MFIAALKCVEMVVGVGPEMVGLKHRFTTSGLDAVLRMLCQAGLQGDSSHI